MGWWWPEDGQKDIIMDGIKLHGVCPPVELYNDDRKSIKEASLLCIEALPEIRGENFDIIDCQGFPYFPASFRKFIHYLGNHVLVITLHEVWNTYWYEYLGFTGNIRYNS